MTRRVFVFEWICGGACEDDEFTRALLPDGRAMLSAVAQDVARLSDTVVETISAVGPIADGVVTHETSSTSWRDDYWAAVKRADKTLVIAPEFAVVAEQLVDGSERFANCGLDSFALFSDKLATYERLHDLVPMPTTVTLENLNALPAAASYVVKPRDGVGEGYEACNSIDDVLAVDRRTDGRESIVQPFVDGVPRSLAVAIRDDGYEIWPSCQQVLAEYGDSLVYGGGQIRPSDRPEVPEWLESVLAAEADFRGYVSVDYIETPEGPVFIEMNPRVSVSYIGYRAATDDNLAAWLLGDAERPVSWNDGSWSWTKHGDVTQQALR